jgi:hypothetical protein
MAVAHSMIVIGFYVIKYRLPYRDLGADSSIRRHRERTLRRAIKRLNSLGYKVTAQEAQAE